MRVHGAHAASRWMSNIIYLYFNYSKILYLPSTTYLPLIDGSARDEPLPAYRR